MPKIVIDEAFIHEVMTALDTLSGSIVPLNTGTGNAVYQRLEDPEVWPGADTFDPGKDLRAAIKTSGKGIHDRLKASGNLMDGLYAGLTRFLLDADEVESLNSVTSAELLGYISLGGPPASTTPPPATPA
ncbi:hypothetical protein ACIA8K_25775 [Catenuloplanes sp. NPDC051500]|uniref:hypothetical protein n=1 Tax=Catenuloplanes sp. NPDC051500 TaxID=3363959 RepID=UPI0037B8994A